MEEAILNQIAVKIRKSQRILIVSHVRPDGDAIGALLGFGLSLQSSGKKVQMVLADGVPASFRHLEGSKHVTRHIKGDFDLSIVLDCSDLTRAGGVLRDQNPDINIDHHITNLNFASINLVDPGAVATSAILAEFLPAWDLQITLPVAEALLSGIISDSLGFRTSNTNPQALRLAANLMEVGANMSELYQHALVSRSYDAARYWGQGLQHLHRQDRLVWTTLTLEDRRIASYNGNDDADLINVLSAIEDVDIVILFNEQKSNHIKVSWRSQPGWDVSKIALQFGGGGHPAAAGADVEGSMEDVQKQVLTTTRKILENFNGRG